MVPALRSMIYRLRSIILRLWREEGSPGRRSRGIAVGVFSGCLPLFGLQTFLGLGLASVFRGNHLFGALSIWIIIRITYLPLYWLKYRVGCFLFGQGPYFQDASEWNFSTLLDYGWIFSSRLFGGSLVVGVFSGLVIGIISFMTLNSK